MHEAQADKALGNINDSLNPMIEILKRTSEKYGWAGRIRSATNMVVFKNGDRISNIIELNLKIPSDTSIAEGSIIIYEGPKGEKIEQKIKQMYLL